MSGSATARRRGRGAQPEGPRATFRQLLPFLFEHKRTLIVVAVLSVVGAATSLVQPLLVGQVIEAVQSDTGIGILVWLLVGFVIVSSVISGFQHYLLQRTGTAVVHSSRRKLIARILHLPTSEFDARRTGDLVSRVGTDTTLLYAVLTQGLADAVGSAVLFLGALIAMLLIDPDPPAAHRGGDRHLRDGRRAAQRPHPHRLDRAAGESRRTRLRRGACGRLDPHHPRLGRHRARDGRGVGARHRRVRHRRAHRQDLVDGGAVSGIALQLSLLVVLGVGGFRVAAGAITIASLISFIMFLFLLVMPLATTFGAITSVNQALGALGRIQEVLDLPTESQDDEAIAAALPPEDAAPGAPAIEFRDVRFTTPRTWWQRVRPRRRQRGPFSLMRIWNRSKMRHRPAQDHEVLAECRSPCLTAPGSPSSAPAVRARARSCR